MTDDNTIDITDRLPIEVRKPWRQKLPHNYAKRIDELNGIRKEVGKIMLRLRDMHHELDPRDEPDVSPLNRTEVEQVRENISAALVLLGCAEGKLVQTVPTEERPSAGFCCSSAKAGPRTKPKEVRLSAIFAPSH